MNIDYFKNGISIDEPTIVLTHTDLDGVGVAVISELFLSNIKEVKYLNYNEFDIEVQRLLSQLEKNPIEGLQIIIGDISPREQNTIDLLDKFSLTNTLLMVDHHPTSNHMNVYNWCSSKSEISSFPTDDGPVTTYRRCATWQLYHILNFLAPNRLLDDNISNRAEKFIHLVNEWDCWYWESSSTNQAMRLNTLYYTLSATGDKDFFKDFILSRILDPEKDEQTRHIYTNMIDQLLLEENIYINSKCEEAKEGVFTTPEKVYNFIYTYSDKLSSQIGNNLNKDLKYDFAVVIPEEKDSISFRKPLGDIDLSEIVKMIDPKGGGHKAAAGCSKSSFITNTNVVLNK